MIRRKSVFKTLVTVFLNTNVCSIHFLIRHKVLRFTIMYKRIANDYLSTKDYLSITTKISFIYVSVKNISVFSFNNYDSITNPIFKIGSRIYM